MRRFLTIALLLVVAPGVATGNLLRPCDCGAEEEQAGRVLCRTGTASASHPAPRCCHATRQAPPAGPLEAGTDGEDEGCGICCKPRTPLAEVGPAAELDSPRPGGRTHAPIHLLDAAPNAFGMQTVAHIRRPAVHRWLITPTGLAVFLI